MRRSQSGRPANGWYPARVAGVFQSVYYVVTGIWPVVHLSSFEWVTGEKTEDWLVRTFGVLVLAIGAVLAYATFRSRDLAVARLLGTSVAVGLAVSETVAWAAGAIGPMYLADAAVHVGLVALWWWPGGTHRPDRARHGASGMRR